jgi:BON domain-containing protein
MVGVNIERGRAFGRAGAAALLLCLAGALGGCAAFGRCGPECQGDAKITAEVRDLFSRSAALGAPNLIDVQTVRGVVYLRGVVSTPYQIEEAASVASQAPGARRVQNLLTVDNSR